MGGVTSWGSVHVSLSGRVTQTCLQLLHVLASFSLAVLGLLLGIANICLV